MSSSKKTKKPPAAVSAYLAEIGSKGGSAGTGEAKRRPSSHYSRAALLGAETRRKQAEERRKVKEAAKEERRKQKEERRKAKEEAKAAAKPKKRGRPRKNPTP